MSVPTHTKHGSPQRIAAEASALRRAVHPGVVELVDADGTMLRTVAIDGRTLDPPPALPLAEIAGLVVALATTLADLHDLGVAHGAVYGEHVLVHPSGRPVLCSLGHPGTVVDDVAGAGRLLQALLERRIRPASEAVKRRPHRPARGVERTGAGAIAALADRAARSDDAHPLTARALAAALLDRVPDARLPLRTAAPLVVDLHIDAVTSSPSAASSGSPIGSKLGERLFVADEVDGAALEASASVVEEGGGTSGTTAVATAQGVPRLVPPRPDAVSPRRRSASAAPIEATAPPDPWDELRVGLASRSHAPRRSRRRAATVFVVPVLIAAAVALWPSGSASAPRVPSPSPAGSGDGTGRFADGILTTGAGRFAVGRPGDLAAAADWACAGRVRVVAVRPSSGRVVAFDRLPDTAGDVTGRPVGQVLHATAILSDDVDGDGCADLRIARRDGPPAQLSLESP